MTAPELSVVVPVHDEALSLPVLFVELRAVLDALGRRAEIIFVDDGSSDGSVEIVRLLVTRDPRVRLVRLRRHAGLTAAFDAGFRAARGDVVVTLDADLQNDPGDIPRLLAALEGVEAVTGWRRVRRDPWIRRISSRIANAIRNSLIGERIRDSACSLRAVRRHCLADLPPFSGMHRFIPTLLAAAGHRVVEVPVHHRPRRFGQSHFGVRNRALVAIQDLLVVRWMASRRLVYEAVEDLGSSGTQLLRAVPSAVRHRRRARPGAATARRLAAFWATAAIVLSGWGLLAGPRPTSDPGAGATEVLLFPQRPPGAVISLWLSWDGPPESAGWAVLGSSTPWSGSDEMLWRRRIHPGWNYLLWSDFAGFATDGPVALRFAEGAQAAWRISTPRVDPHYRLHHLTPLRGLLLALALATGIAMAGAALWPVTTQAIRREGRWWLAVAGVVGLALWLRLYTLTLPSLWFDEVLTAIGAQSLAWVVYTPQIFGHPPLQYLAAWAAGGGAADEWWLRIPSLLAGVATVAALAGLGRRLFGPGTGLAAAFALSVSPFHVELSQLARPYALFLLLTVLSLSALFWALHRDRARDWLWLSALLGLNLYTHYLAAQVLVLEAVMAAVFLARRRWRGTVPALVSFGGAAVLLLPWVSVLRRLGSAQLGQGDLPVLFLHELVTQVFVPQFLGPGGGTLGALGLLACAFWSLRHRADLAFPMLLWLTLPVAALWVAQPAHFIAGRHLAFVFPILMLLLGHGVATVADAVARAVREFGVAHRSLPRLGAALTAALLVAAWGASTAEGLRDYYQSRLGPDWRTVASVLDRLVSEEDRVFATVGAAYPLRHYWSLRIEELSAAGLPEAPSGGPGRHWVVTHEGRDRPEGLTAWLETYAVKVTEVPASWSLPGIEIFRLRQPPPGLPRADGAGRAALALERAAGAKHRHQHDGAAQIGRPVEAEAGRPPHRTG